LKSWSFRRSNSWNGLSRFRSRFVVNDGDLSRNSQDSANCKQRLRWDESVRGGDDLYRWETLIWISKMGRIFMAIQTRRDRFNRKRIPIALRFRATVNLQKVKGIFGYSSSDSTSTNHWITKNYCAITFSIEIAALRICWLLFTQINWLFPIFPGLFLIFKGQNCLSAKQFKPSLDSDPD
jgi:hypothetical protein